MDINLDKLEDQALRIRDLMQEILDLAERLNNLQPVKFSLGLQRYDLKPSPSQEVVDAVAKRLATMAHEKDPGYLERLLAGGAPPDAAAPIKVHQGAKHGGYINSVPPEKVAQAEELYKLKTKGRKEIASIVNIKTSQLNHIIAREGWAEKYGRLPKKAKIKQTTITRVGAGQ